MSGSLVSIFANSAFAHLALVNLAFASPWLLTGLAALPIIWWLLRTTPPGPTRIAFPPTRLLRDLVSKEKTPARSPWWLTLMRMLAAAAIIFALAEPVVNPTPLVSTSADRLVLVLDNGWASAAKWEARTAALDRILASAESAGQPVIITPTAGPVTNSRLRFEDANTARDRAAGIVPLPYAPDRDSTLERLKTAIGNSGPAANRIVWLGDGYDYGNAEAFAEGLSALAGKGGSVTLANPSSRAMALALRRKAGDARALQTEVLSAPASVPRTGRVIALSQKGQKIATSGFVLPGNATSTEVSFTLPLEIRNQIVRIEIQGEASAGAVQLLDARSRWNRVGLITGANREKDQPLLSPLYYLARALKPFTDVVQSTETSTAAALEDLLKQRSSTIILADIGNLAGHTSDKLGTWVRKGGVLVRFAGPHLEQGNDSLLPSPLRFGGRTLGGALSWSEPQKLAAMDEKSLFAGLVAPPDVVVRRQVLADPGLIGPNTKIWARLADGTPLVTARALDDGWLVLFHITANSDWSNLPLSGLFVDMLRRILTLGEGTSSGSLSTATSTEGSTLPGGAAQAQSLLAPRRILDGRGLPGAPPPTAKPIALRTLDSVRAGPDHPPGYYGPIDGSRAINAVSRKTVLNPLPALTGITHAGYPGSTVLPLKPWLFLAGLGLLLLDGLAVLWLSGLRPLRRRAMAAGLAVIFTGLTFTPGSLSAPGSSALAQEPGMTGKPSQTDTAFALEATLKTRLAYVITGDEATDETSRLGLTGLQHILAQRTAVESGTPVGVDIGRDELAFFPILYWPVMADAPPLSDTYLEKIDAYMKTGGLIIFDTRDFGSGLGGSLGGVLTPGGQTPLQRMLGKLDIPRLEPVPDGHVLTKSFYLLSDFPGRWSGGDTWVEARSGRTGDGKNRQGQQSDGVSSLLVTSNDLAAAWAMDESGMPLHAVVPGGRMQREMAYRTGVNIVMYALTGNYKADQVHIPDLLKRLGQ